MQQFNTFFKNKNTNNNTNDSQPPPVRRKSHDPILSPEDEAFLRNVTSESPSATAQDSVPSEQAGDQPSSPLSGDAQAPAPISPVEEFGKELGERERRKSLTEHPTSNEEPSATGTTAEPSAKARPSGSPKKKRPWTMLWKKSDKKAPETREPETAPAPTTDLATTETPSSDKETKQENEDMTEILDKLNLAADNNRVFSISDETQELLRKFKLIFKDLINGVPTAYHDLEMLLTNGNRQLQDTYSGLPSFLQKLIEKLPERWTESLAPEMIAAATERASKSGVNVDNFGKAAAAANKMGLQVPSLKELVGKPAAIVGMLRSIMAFLRARFPAVLGMNVLWSLALFILLFVLWYCHKRGREVRLENERLVTEEEIEKMNQDSSDGAGTESQIRSTETLTTTAAQGASASEVREGIKEAQKAREKKTSSIAGEQTQPQAQAQEQKENEKGDKPVRLENEPIKPTRSKSILSIFGRSGSTNSTPTTASKVTPYPGT
ncbi:uncharacterized protein APUU_30374S [Aspergillus puulaauensis]|uniref:Uncharacterized protein n=1 Tax=Aspergillus puulaauensis TaxID=1220207 RepID=A0A7R8AJU5_9EURO|nr:uncharacterized protein APUU_30374S [Aspergillus puulaauensis]BCS22149.1 hypothetical protein APUU_30374S [Aspergillus puulaauensis]